MTDKQQYISLCADEQYSNLIPVFSQPFWLNAVAENWDVVLLHDASTKLGTRNIVAALPFCWKGKLLTKRIYLPDFNFYQSIIFFEYFSAKERNKIAVTLFQQLPKTIKSYFKFLPEYTSIDLSKLNYQKEDYATYIIHKNQQEFSISTNHKRNIQKGVKLQYLVKESTDIKASFSLLTSTFARQSLKLKINFDTFEKINHLVKKHNCGKTIDCLDIHGNLLASVFIVVDAHTAYYLFGGYNAAFKNSGAMTFLLFDVIQAAIQQNRDFNFCGSSKKTIAHFFEGFGATKTEISIWQKSII